MSKIRPALPYLICLLLAALILDLGNPLFDKPARDGGFFLYTGSQILNGKIPYLDFWDSKGPAIFYINALGLLLGQGSRWGVWTLEFVFAFAWLLVAYKIALKKWSDTAAVFGIVLAALGLRIVLGYGNYTEEYALLFNILALYFFFSDEDKGWKYFWIGVCFGVSFSFRANNIGGLFAVLIASGIADFSPQVFGLARTKVRIPILLLGFAIPLFLWTIYFQTFGAAWDMIYASIIFNFSYASAKSRELLDIFGGFGRYGMSWVGWVAALGYLVYGYGVIRKAMRRDPLSMLDVFLIVWFPVEILLSNLSGRNFSHYYISWAAAVAVYGAALFAFFTGSADISPRLSWQMQTNIRAPQHWFVFVNLFLIAGLLVVFSPSVKRYGETVSRLFSGQSIEYSDPLAEYIRANTRQDELVLTWYPESTLNFLAARTSPVKYIYYPLFLDGSLTAEVEDGYFEGLTSRRPGMIVDCSRAVDAIPALDRAAREDQFSKPGVKKKMYIQPGMEKIFSFVAENYHVETSVDGCFIFRLNVE